MDTKPLPRDLDRVSTNPHGLTITNDDVTALLAMIDRKAHVLTRGAQMASVEDFQDCGRDALLTAWRVWNGTIPFPAFARYCISRRMRGGERESTRWHLPCAPSALPDAELLERMARRPITKDGTGGTWDMLGPPPESEPWFRRDLQQHLSCMSPTLQQTLTDTLADLPAEVIMARDRVANQTVHKRYAALVTFLRRHVYHRETSCLEEAAHWQPGRPSAGIDPAVRAAHRQVITARWRAANRDRQRGYVQASRLRRKARVSLAAAD